MRYILILGLALLAAAFTLSSFKTEPAQAPWETLFDGKSVDKLRGYQRTDFPSECWSVENGLLKTIPGVKNTDLLTRQQYKNFELQLDWKTSTAGNGGIFYNVQEDARQESGNGNSPNWLTNFEMQLLDDIGFNDKEPKRSAGSLYDLIAPKNKALKPVGTFNTSRLVVKNKHVEHWLNGQKVVEYTIDSPELNALIQASKFKDIEGFAQYTEGFIMFQHHGQEMWYKNIKIRRL
jgi:hypothetical protein